MNRCERLQQAGAYHDGELTPDERTSFESHLPGCGECRAELAELARMSALFAAARIPDMPQRTRERLHGNAVAAPQRGVLKLAEQLIAAAAVITVACGGLLWRGAGTDESGSANDTAWRKAAVTLNVETVSGDAQQLAQWMAEELAVENSNE